MLSRGTDPRPKLDGSGVKAMPGSISAPNSGSLEEIRSWFDSPDSG